jgi:hypothetical protein
MALTALLQIAGVWLLAIGGVDKNQKLQSELVKCERSRVKQTTVEESFSVSLFTFDVSLAFLDLPQRIDNDKDDYCNEYQNTNNYWPALPLLRLDDRKWLCVRVNAEV